MQASVLCSTPAKAGMVDILQELYGDSWRTPNMLKNEKIQEELKARQAETNFKDKSKIKKSSYREGKTSDDNSNKHNDYYYQVVEQKETSKYVLKDSSFDKDLHYSETHTLKNKPNYSKIPTDSEDEEPLILRRKKKFDKIINISSDEDNSIVKTINNEEINNANQFIDNISSSENEIIENSICISESNSKPSPDDSFIKDSDSSSVDSFENTPAFYNRLDSEIKKSNIKKPPTRKIKAPVYKYYDSDSDSDDNIMSATICNIENDDIDDIADSFDDFKISGGISKDSLSDLIKKLDFQDVQKSTKKNKASSNIKRISSLSFLESLSENVDIQMCHVDAIPYIKNFKKTREDLTQTLFELFNRKVFDGKLHPDFQIIWCNNLRTTAGFCKPNRFFKDGEVIYKCTIRLSTKVVDRPCRVRDTLIHELCHAANFEIDRIRDAKHGQRWKYWTRKAERCFPELPEISVKHDYVIEYNFIYECDTCRHRVYRHKNTMDANENCDCGFGNYKGFRKQPDGKLKPIESSTRKPSAFAIFVKENYGSVKSTFKNHKDCMRELSNLYGKQKNKLS